MTTPYSSPQTRTFYTTPYVTQTDLYRIRYYRELIQNAKNGFNTSWPNPSGTGPPSNSKASPSSKPARPSSASAP